jgi:hypothetical protein
MDLEQMLAQQLDAVVKAHLPEGEMVKKADVDAAIAALKTEMQTLVADAVAKALPLDRNGTGRQGTVQTEVSILDDPAAYIAKKAQAIKDGKEQDYTTDEKHFIGALFIDVLKQGMKE